MRTQSSLPLSHQDSIFENPYRPHEDKSGVCSKVARLGLSLIATAKAHPVLFCTGATAVLASVTAPEVSGSVGTNNLPANIAVKRFELEDKTRIEHWTPELNASRWHAVSVYYPTNSAIGDQNLSQGDGFPLMVFSSGYTSNQEAYSDLLQKMVNKGFVVAALEHPYADSKVVVNGQAKYSQGVVSMFSDQQKALIKQLVNLTPHLTKWVPPTKWVAASVEQFLQKYLRMSISDFSEFSDQKNNMLSLRQVATTMATDAANTIAFLDSMNQDAFNGQIDFNRIVYAGHSLGGGAAQLLNSNSVSLNANKPLAGAISYDGSTYGLPIEFNNPVMYLLAEKNGNGDLKEYFEGRINHSADDNTRANSVVKQIEGSEHMSFAAQCTNPLALPFKLEPFLQNLLNIHCGTVDYDEVQEKLADLTYEFAMKNFQAGLN